MDRAAAIRKRGDRISLCAAALTVALGVAVMLGWALHLRQVVQVLPGAAPMQFNTALGLTMAGLTLLLHVRYGARGRAWASAAAAACGLLGAAVLGQYAFGLERGIDRLLLEPFLAVPAEYPGRMAVNTAAAFVGVGLALLALVNAGAVRGAHLTAALLGAVVLAVGLYAVLGYAAGVGVAYGWTRHIAMAPHTAAGWILAGGGIAARAWMEGATALGKTPAWSALPLLLAGLLLSVSLWQVLRDRNDAHIRRIVAAEVSSVARLIRDQTEQRFAALARMADRFAADPTLPRAAWARDASNYLRDQPGNLTILVLDATGAVRWGEPQYGADAEARRHLQPVLSPLRREALAQLDRHDRSLATQALALPDESLGFKVYLPFWRDGARAGAVAAIVRYEGLFSPIGNALPLQGYGVAILEGDRTVYRAGAENARLERSWGATAAVGLPNLDWHVRVWPSPTLLERLGSAVDTIALALGIVLSACLAAAVYYGRTAGLRAEQADHAYAQLQAEIAGRRELEERFGRVVEAAPNALVIVNAAGRIQLANSQTLRWFGYAHEELLGQLVEVLVPERFRDAHPELREAFAAAPKVRPMGTGRELYGRRKDGSEFPVDITLSPLDTPEGMQVIAAITDMTLYREAEEARRGLEERFRQVVEAAPNALIIADASGRIRLANSQTLRWFGYAHEELLGQLVEVLVPERFRDAHPELREAFATAPKVRPMGTGRELYGRRKDGSEFPVDITLSPLETPDGMQVIAAITDMTLYREAEEARRGLEERFSQLIEAAPNALVIVAADGRIRLVNTQVLRWFGYTREELLGQPVEVLIPERFRNSHPEHRQAYMAWPTTRPMGTGRDLYGRRKGGSEFPVDISLSPVATSEGPLIIASVTDMTEHKKAEADLRRSNEALERVNRELEAFSYSVSHDLRAPLRGMTGFAQILLEDHGPGLDETGRGYLGRIRVAAERMGSLIDDLLALSRVTRGEIHRERVELGAVAKELLDELRGQEPERAVEVHIQPGLSADCDARLLRVMLVNLLGNAWKFTCATPQARIEVGQMALDNGRVFYVRDNGAGFDMAYVDKLFSPFQRLHRTDEFPGTGIGLATAQRIVQRHGGRIWGEGAVGRGAAFYFTF